MKWLERWKFKGADIPKHKGATKDKETVTASVPRLLYFPMDMHIGTPARVAVEPGDRVRIGTLLGSDEEGISANVHSSVSGTVIETGPGKSLRGEAQWVVVENDFADEEERLDEIGPMDPDAFSARLEAAGITGKGGAGFPAAVKYDKDAKEVDYLLVNGAECEPYSTSDYRCMVENADEIVRVIDAIEQVYHLKYTVIAVEDHMTEAISHLQRAITKANSHLQVHLLPSDYPQGHDGLQIRSVLGIELEEGQRSGDAGILQSNVSTMKAIHDAVFYRQPLTQRIITVTGPMLKEPKNLMVRVGTPVEHLIAECGGFRDQQVQMISGGPMMGKPFEDPRLPVDKNTTTLLFLPIRPTAEETDCIRCARCVIHCPVDLQPILIRNSLKEGAFDKAKALRSESCIACGTCTFICPARIPLLDNIQAFNEKVKEQSHDK